MLFPFDDWMMLWSGRFYISELMMPPLTLAETTAIEHLLTTFYFDGY
jgi:hypothetical protein